MIRKLNIISFLFLLLVITTKGLNIFSDTSLLGNGSPPSGWVTYMKSLIKPCVTYFNAALRRRYSLTSIPITKQSNYSSNCPSGALDSASSTADMYFWFVGQQFSSPNTYAETIVCQRTFGKEQPMIARGLFNTLSFPAPSTSDLPGTQILRRERHIYVILHEMTHAFGFGSSHFDNWWDIANNNHFDTVVKNRTFPNGVIYNTIIVPEVVNWARDYYNCPTLPGLPLENNSGGATRGEHPDKRWFPWEAISSSAWVGSMRMTEVVFKVLDATGWWLINRDFIEPGGFGKGAGCEFFGDPDSLEDLFPKEYCNTSLSEYTQCTFFGRSWSYCSTNNLNANLIPLTSGDANNDCWDDSADINTTNERWNDRGTWHRCFFTVLSSTGPTSAPRRRNCLKYECNPSSSQITLWVGKSCPIQITCNYEGEEASVGSFGYVRCPDPVSFCQNEGKKYCPRNCMGNGSCSGYTCTCNPGWRGYDCSQSTSDTFYGSASYGI